MACRGAWPRASRPRASGLTIQCLARRRTEAARAAELKMKNTRKDAFTEFTVAQMCLGCAVCSEACAAMVCCTQCVAATGEVAATRRYLGGRFAG